MSADARDGGWLKQRLPGTEGAVEFLGGDRPGESDMGWQIEAGRADPVAGAIGTRLPRAAADESPRTVRAFPDDAASLAPEGSGRIADKRPDRLPGRAPAGRARGHLPAESTCAAISYGRCWTTSSGPRVIRKRF